MPVLISALQLILSPLSPPLSDVLLWLSQAWCQVTNYFSHVPAFPLMAEDLNAFFAPSLLPAYLFLAQEPVLPRGKRAGSRLIADDRLLNPSTLHPEDPPCSSQLSQHDLSPATTSWGSPAARGGAGADLLGLKRGDGVVFRNLHSVPLSTEEHKITQKMSLEVSQPPKGQEPQRRPAASSHETGCVLTKRVFRGWNALPQGYTDSRSN